MLNGPQRISVVDGETQDSAAHERRLGAGRYAVDLPGTLGQPLQGLVAGDPVQRGYDAENGFWALWWWNGSRGLWSCRFSHLLNETQAIAVGTSGQSTGTHLHLVLSLNGERVKPEEQVEFVTLLV